MSSVARLVQGGLYLSALGIVRHADPQFSAHPALPLPCSSERVGGQTDHLKRRDRPRRAHASPGYGTLGQQKWEEGNFSDRLGNTVILRLTMHGLCAPRDTWCQ